MGEKALFWVERLLAALGGVVPQDPAEVLKVLGALLRADPAEKEQFVRDAHAVWVGAEAWVVRGDPSPEARAILMALEEATRRLAEKHRWVREKGSRPRVRVAEENIWESRVKVVRQAQKGPGVFFLRGPEGLTEKARWAAAYRAAKGGEVVLVAPPALEGTARKLARLIARRAAELDGGRSSTPTVRTPQGRVRLLFGDRWEAPEAPEPRLQWALGMLREAAEEAAEAAEASEDRDWVHQTRVDPRLIRGLLGDEAEGVETAYLLANHSLVRELLDSLDEVVGDKEFNVYAAPTVRTRKPWFQRWAFSRAPTFGEIREAWAGFLETRGRKEVWYWGKMARLLFPLAAAEALVAGAWDAESAVMEAVEEALAEARRLRRKDRWDRLNPLVFLAPVVRRKVAEIRVREFGVSRISRDEARAVSRYFRYRAEGLEPAEAVAKAELPPHLEEAISGGHGSWAVSTDFLRDYGFEPAGEMDYDRLLLRVKVGEVIEEVEAIWGGQGVLFVEHLLDGRGIPAAQTLTPGLTPVQATEILQHLRRELEGWADA